MFTDDVARHDIELVVSGTVGAWVFPKAWYGDGRFRRLKLVAGLALGALKRLWQALILPYRYDAVVVLRTAFAFTGPPWFEKLLRRRANFMIFELDDSLWVEHENGAPPFWTEQRPIYAATASDRVIAGSSYLADWASQYCADVRIVPTTAADDITPRQGARAPGPVRIGWYGNWLGSRYCEPIMPALVETAGECDIEFRLLTHGPYERVLDIPEGLPFGRTVWEAETESRDLEYFDVGLMPLKDDETSRGKCGAKILHYMAAGLPVVASPVGVNSDIVVHGETGFLADSHNEWVEALTLFSTDADLRERMGKAGLARYENKYAPSVVAEEYAAAITPPAEIGRRRFPRS